MHNLIERAQIDKSGTGKNANDTGLSMGFLNELARYELRELHLKAESSQL